MKQTSSDDIYAWAKAGAGLAALKDFYERLIPPAFPTRFPEDFRLAPADWHLPSDVVHRHSIKSDFDDDVRPIGTLDVEFLSNDIIDEARAGKINLARQYPCGMKCPGCFSDDATYLDAAKFLKWQDVFNIIDDARNIGLTSIKFLGPGELFQNRDLFDILDAAEARSMPLSIFTKGAELGDDRLARYIYQHVGVQSALELVERIAEYSCVRVLLGFNSFDPVRQDLMVGSHGVTGHYEIRQGRFVNRGVERYTEKRNQALLNLFATGLVSTTPIQRVSLIAAPAGLDQIEEIVEMYSWSARRNIPLIIAPTMESGPKAIGLMRFNNKTDPLHEKLRDMYLMIYSRAIEEGITQLAAIIKEGISAYMGTAPCNQVANGLYLRLNGQVQMCPGTSNAESVFGNIHQNSITQIWRESRNYTLGPRDNNWCLAKTNGMPESLQDEVLQQLAKRYGRDQQMLGERPKSSQMKTPPAFA
jgi:MoaA/NifB/PqqE/SkfB family radical SAM enzyme